MILHKEVELSSRDLSNISKQKTKKYSNFFRNCDKFRDVANGPHDFCAKGVRPTVPTGLETTMQCLKSNESKFEIADHFNDSQIHPNNRIYPCLPQ